jgi:hypothetical protein
MTRWPVRPDDGAVEPFFTWLISGAIGPAAVGLPVNWAAEKLADAATRWFKRLRHTDDLSRLVTSAAGDSAGLTKDEFAAVRKLLERPKTWDALGSGTVDQIAADIAACLPARAGRDSPRVAETIARGLLEFAVHGLEPDVFQDVLKARLTRMQNTQAASDRARDEALLGLHADLMAGFADVLDRLDLALARLAPGPAQRTEILVYLGTLINELGTDTWVYHWYRGSELSEATVERKLYLTSGPERDLEADLLADQCERLVIRGDPGSGKTWLARRTARRCAERARDVLAAGSASLDQVEIPLYTTCSALFAAGSDVRAAGVSSALEALPDLGGGRIKAALREFFMARSAPTLLVIDSLDEAYGSDKILGRARNLPWRVMLTTRPSSWRGQLDLEPGNRDHRVGDIQPLRYPGDVVPFIGQWFAGRPDQGEALAVQIASRADLQQAATVPLILTFCCILGGTEPLPEFRSDLYRKLFRCMLDGYWHDIAHPRDQPPLDREACLRTLGDWAWADAQDRVDPVSGVGTWADEIAAKPVWLGPLAAGALDHIAPPVDRDDDDTGLIPRRFIHRSVREYLVAERLGGLTVEQAADVLMPHLWYDLDWTDVAPAALALHPERDRLLRELIGRATGTGPLPGDLAALDAGGEFRRFLARTACQSREADWSPDVAQLIGRARMDLIQAGQMDDVGWAVHWETSNAQARAKLLAQLPGQAAGRDAAQLAVRLIQLNPTADDARQACQVLAGLLAERTGFLPGQVVDVMVRLAVAAQVEQDARDTLLSFVTSPDERGLAVDMARGMARLSPSSDEKRQACDALLAHIAGQDGYGLLSLADALGRLSPAPDVGQRARQVIGEKLAVARNGQMAAKLAAALARLDPTLPEKQQALDVLERWLARDAAVALDPALRDHRASWFTERRSELFHAHNAMRDELDGLVELAATEEEKRIARTAVLGLLRRQPDSFTSGQLAAALARLDPTEADKLEARGILLRSLTQEAACYDAAQLCDGLIALDPTPPDKRQARTSMLGLLAGPDASNASWLPGRLARLDLRPEEAQRARAALLEYSQADDLTAETLLGWLLQMDPTPQEKLRACDILLGFVEHATGDAPAVRLALAMAQLDPPPRCRDSARRTLLDLLAGAAGPAAGQLTSAIAALNPTPDDKLRAGEILRGLLASGDASTQIPSGLAQLDPPVSEISGWLQWPAPPPAELLAAARRCSPLHDWLEALPTLPAQIS